MGTANQPHPFADAPLPSPFDENAMKPFPTELKVSHKVISDGQAPCAEEQRNLFCPRYDKCLNEAVKKGWNSFSCLRCDSYNATPTPQDQRRHSAGLEAYATQRREG